MWIVDLPKGLRAAPQMIQIEKNEAKIRFAVFQS